MPIIKIKPEERTPTAILMLMFFCIVGASITGSSARDTFFLIEFDKSLLPLMFAVVAIVMVSVITIYNRIAVNLDLIKVILVSTVFFCLTLFFIMLKLEGVVIPIFYVWIDVIISITILQFWLLASEIFDPRQAKRLFSFIGIGGSLAGISAGYLIRPFVKTFGAESLLIPTIILIGLVAAFAIVLIPYRPINSKVKATKILKQSNQSTKQRQVFDPYLRSILLMVCSAAICSRIVEYQFKISAVNTYPTSETLASFFGEYYMILNAVTLIMQLFLTGYVLNNFGVLGGLLLLPLGLAIGSISFFIFANLSSIFLARLVDQAFKFSVQSTSNEILWTPVQRQKSRRAKPLIDSSFKSIAEGIIGIIIYFFITTSLLPSNKIYLLSVPIVFFTALWVWNNFRIKTRYISTLEDAINHRHLNLENIHFDTADSHIIKTIETALNDKDIYKQLFAIDLIKNLPLNKWRETLNNLLRHGKFEVQKQILILASNRKRFLDKDILLKLSGGIDEVAALAITLNSKKVLKNLSIKLLENLSHSNGHIKAASAVGLLRINKHDKGARKILKDFLDVKDEEATALALDYLKTSSDLLPRKTLYNLLSHPSTDISISALNVAGNRLDEYYLPAIISNLGNVKTAQKARMILKPYNNISVVSALEACLENSENSLYLSLGIVRCFSIYPTIKTVSILKLLFDHNQTEISIASSDALLKIAKTGKIGEEFKNPLIKNIKKFSTHYFRLHCLKLLMKNDKNTMLMQDQIRTEQKFLVHIILKLVSLQVPNSPIESHIKSIINNRDTDLPYILEFIDTSFGKKIRNILMPIIDPEIDYKRKEIKIEQNKNDIVNSLKTWAESDNDWKSVIAIEYLLKHNQSMIEIINWGKVSPSPYLSEIFNKYPDNHNIIPITKFKNQSEQTMFTILEKTMLLKTVDLFQDIPGQLLSQISQISRAKTFEQGEIIFNEGDSGDSMFILLSGEVSIKKGRKFIAKLERGASLGEMSLLDHEARSADALAEKDSVLLKINQDVFYELMESNADIMKQIIRLLTSRIREANSKLEQSLK